MLVKSSSGRAGRPRNPEDGRHLAERAPHPGHHRGQHRRPAALLERREVPRDAAQGQGGGGRRRAHGEELDSGLRAPQQRDGHQVSREADLKVVELLLSECGRPLSEGAEAAGAEPMTALDYVQRRFRETYDRKKGTPSSA